MQSNTAWTAGIVVALAVVFSGCSGSSTTTTGSGASATVACRQKADADNNAECAGQAGKPRKLDCVDDQTDQAIAAGCVRQKAGDRDVCCPTTIAGTPTTPAVTPTTVACQQKPDADTGTSCASHPGKTRKLDCDADQTAAALTAGCEREKAGGSDVCCPTTITGSE